MVKKRVALPAAGVGVALACGLAGSRIVSRWRRNPDPLGGRQVVFPDGEQRFVTMPDGAAISTVTVGTGPTIVCVHGLTGNRHDWGPLAPALLDAGFQLVAVEQRGHGDSSAGTAGFGSEQLGEDLAAVFTELDLKAVALMGHSMGGMAIMSFGADAPEALRARVDSLILIATAASLKTLRHGFGLRAGGVSIPKSLAPENDRLRLAASLVFGKRPSLHMIDEVLRQFAQMDEDVRSAATVALAEHDVRGRLASVDLPALVIGGTRDHLISAGQVRDLVEDELADGELHLLNNAGHMVIWERHERIAELILNFLGRTGESTALDKSALDGTALDGTALDGTALDGAAQSEASDLVQ